MGGSKINLWDDGNINGDHYGIGIQPGILQLYTYTPNDDIAFGYGNSDNFNEQFRVKGSGALAVQGNAGSAGQALISNGNNAPPQWKTQPQHFFFELPSGGSQILLPRTYLPVPSIDNQSFVLNYDARLIITAIAHVYTVAGETVPQEPNFFFRLSNNGTFIMNSIEGYTSIKPQPSTFVATDLTVTQYTYVVPAGTYTLDFNIRNLSATGNGYFNSAQVIIQAIPN